MSPTTGQGALIGTRLCNFMNPNWMTEFPVIGRRSAAEVQIPPCCGKLCVAGHSSSFLPERLTVLSKCVAHCVLDLACQQREVLLCQRSIWLTRVGLSA